jgi:hypothetical protein
MQPPELIASIEKVHPKPEDDQYLAKLTQGDGMEVCRHVFHYRADQLVHLEPQWMLEKAVPRHAWEQIRRGTADTGRLVAEERQLAAYSQRLYRFLFGDGVQFNALLQFDASYRQQARLTLAVHPNAAALWRLPWEYLHNGADFVALTGRFLLSRSVTGLAALQPPPLSLPLRILVVIAAPDDQPPLDTEEEIGVLQAALDEPTRAGLVQMHYLDDATLLEIGDALRRFQPHVLHYTGHGAFDTAQDRSELALENDRGQTRRAGITELRPHLQSATDLRLVVLSGCQTAQTSTLDAFRGVATSLLQVDIPAVLAMQFSILDQSGIVLARALYAALAQGETLTSAVHRTRVALWQDEAGPGYDWGVPVLYLRALDLHLVALTAQPTLAPQLPVVLDSGGLPLTPYFVGRKPELRALRHAMRERHITAAFVRGIGGLGKSSLVAKLIQRPGIDLDDVLVIRCHKVDPADIPAKLADFLRARGHTGHAEAAACVLDSTRPPAERARESANLIADRRYLFVFDNFESVMAMPEGAACEGLREDSAYDVADPVLAGLLDGLLGAQWHSLCLFTGRYRWRAFDEHLGRGTAVELHLPALSPRQTIMLMDNLPRLRQEPLQTKIVLMKKVGGHPKSIELLQGWLASGRVTDLLNDPRLDGLLAQQWEEYFLRASWRR